ncbi:hypothetical protein HK096_000321, partial [Nowakowskiella sp. JEL0078]
MIFCFAVCILQTVALIYVELKIAKDPIIPAAVFMNITVYLTLFISFLNGAIYLS